MVNLAAFVALVRVVCITCVHYMKTRHTSAGQGAVTNAVIHPIGAHLLSSASLVIGSSA